VNAHLVHEGVVEEEKVVPIFDIGQLHDYYCVS
jgi:hypothetical protein